MALDFLSVIFRGKSGLFFTELRFKNLFISILPNYGGVVLCRSFLNLTTGMKTKFMKAPY